MQRLNVVGVFKVGADLDGSLGMIHRADAAQIHRWMPQQVQGVRLKLDDLYRAPEVAAQVQAGQRLPPGGLVLPRAACSAR